MAGTPALGRGTLVAEVGMRPIRWWLHGWRRLEHEWWRFWRRMRRRGRQLDAQAKAIGRELWDLVDDLPFVSALAPIEPVLNQFYGHGSFMGAAPAMLEDPRWRRILAFLMPDVYDDVKRVLATGAHHGRIIPMFENNPVMAAYGTWRNVLLRRDRDLEPGPNDLSGHEWDVFVDSLLVEAWERASADEADAILERIVDGMLIAHATTTDTAQEHLGICQYGDVRRTAKSALGGVEMPAWLDLFARALALVEADDLRAAIAAMSRDERHVGVEACKELTFVRPWPPSEAVVRSQRLTGRPHLSIVLEIKSLRSTPELLVAIVGDLNRRGIHVAAVGSFLRAEIEGVSRQEQQVAGERLPAPREILFFHTEGDLQAACEAGTVPPGQHALFNGAGLLERDGFGGYRADDELIAELEGLRRRHALHLGFYVQESNCDASAAAALSRLSQRHLQTFELGFAWGGLQDEAALLLGQSDDCRGFGAQALLIRLGRAGRWRFGGEAAPPRGQSAP